MERVIRMTLKYQREVLFCKRDGETTLVANGKGEETK
jgi:hypothetical protein